MVYKVAQQSAVIKPSATLGAVTAGPRVSVCRLGSEHFLTASVGASFHIYDCDDLQLQYLSRPMRGQITGILSVGELTVAAVGAEMHIFHKMVVLAVLEGHTKPVQRISSIGDSTLVSVGGDEVLVWKLPTLTTDWTGEMAQLQPLKRLAVDFDVSCLLAVPTYVNKMLVGGVSGELELWNVNKGDRIHSFACSQKNSVGVSALAAAPVLDVVGVGYSDGCISVINLKQDESLMTLKQSEHGSVTSISFRQDAVGGQLVSGTDKGDLVVWDLNKRAIHSFLKSVHPKGVSSIDFLDTLPLMVTSGRADNAISVYLFDLPDGGCRLLKERRGFTSSFSHIVPYGEHDLVVGGESEVGKLNLVQSHQNKVWPQSALRAQTSSKPWKFRNIQQLPQITSLSTTKNKLRHFDWPAIASTHQGLTDAYLWSPHQEALVSRLLTVPRKKTTGSAAPEAVGVAMSPCGNYAALALDDGEVHRFNVQSCYHRGIITSSESRVKKIEFFSSRDLVIASTDSIEIWKIVPRPALVSRLTSVTSISGFSIFGYLCAVSHENFHKISIIDMHSDKLVRTLPLTAPFSAMAWAEGGKWLAVASLDKRMVIYDVATAGVIDRVEFSSNVKSLAFVHHNAQLVTSHEDGKGAIRVWQNLALLESPGPVTKKFVPIDAFDEKNLEKESPVLVPAVETEAESSGENGMMQVWNGSRNRWQEILKLDEIKERNKPAKGLMEKHKAAPFFLPVKYMGVEPVFVRNEAADKATTESSEPEVKKQKMDGFLDMVERGNFEMLRNHLVAQTSSGVHICIAELEESELALKQFTRFLALETEQGRNIDLVASWIALFAKLHAAQIRGMEGVSELQTAAKRLANKFDQATNKLQCLLKVTAALQLHR